MDAGTVFAKMDAAVGGLVYTTESEAFPLCLDFGITSNSPLVLLLIVRSSKPMSL